MLAVLLMGGAKAWAQAPTKPAATSADTEAKLSVPIVEWTDAQAVFPRIERWVRAGEPADADPDDAHMVSGVYAVRVTVRWLGREMGSGEAINRSLLSRPTQPVDLNAMCREATNDALVAIAAELMRAARGLPGSEPIEGEQAVRRTLDQKAKDRLAKTQVDLQIAAMPEAIRITADSPPDAIYETFVPGYHGLRVALPQINAEAVVWPATELARNNRPSVQITAALARLSLKPELIPQVGRDNGPTLHRLDVIHYVRSTRDLPPQMLTRGKVILPADRINDATLRGIAARAGEHLINRLRRDGTMAGTYRPSVDRYDPETSLLDEHALSIWALARWGKALGDDQPIQRNIALDAASRGLAYLHALVDTRRPVLAGPIALTLLATMEMSDIKPTDTMRDKLLARLIQSQRGDGVWLESTAEGAAPVTAEDQAIIIVALLRAYAVTRHEAIPPALTRGLSALLDSHEASRLPVQPWLAQIYAMLPPPRDGEQDSSARAQLGDDLVRRANVLLDKQLVEAPRGNPDDVVGGFDLTWTIDSSIANPDWQSAQGLAALAILLRTDRAAFDTDDAKKLRVIDVVISSKLAARFVAQLMFDEPDCYYVRSTRDAMGGVRRSTFDNFIDARQTAWALIAALEFGDSLDHLLKQRLADQPSTGNAESAPAPVTQPEE